MKILLTIFIGSLSNTIIAKYENLYASYYLVYKLEWKEN